MRAFAGMATLRHFPAYAPGERWTPSGSTPPSSKPADPLATAAKDSADTLAKNETARAVPTRTSSPRLLNDIQLRVLPAPFFMFLPRSERQRYRVSRAAWAE